jgi:cytochrome c-type biogenesis protein
MTDALSLATFATAFAAGLLSVLSPCVMPLMPAYLSLISGISVDELHEGQGAGEGPDLRARVMRGSLGFVAGFSAVFVLLGASATVIGRTLITWHVTVGGVEIGFVQLAGVLIVLMGLHLVGWLPIGLLYRDAHLGRHLQPKGFAGTFLVGAAFAFGWSPCVGPILGGILTLAGGRETVYQGMALLAVYSAGLAVPFLLAGWSVSAFFRTFDRMKRHLRRVEVVAGALLLAVGLLVTTNRLSVLNDYFLFLNDVVERAEQALL